ncbi:hypothetical protein KSP40_PGU011317 [Platanthera guangdongensis]|uniref:Uncharacterized protein n=1 Tax=Platanthera guangdongensis TaxID=2320717 RepID=A0ABR2MHK5_9ASPA
MGGRKITFLSLPVLAVVFLMGYVYYTTVFVLLPDWLELSSDLGRTNALIFSFFAFMCMFAFVASVFTDPGRVPSSFAPDAENPQANDTHFLP